MWAGVEWESRALPAPARSFGCKGDDRAAAEGGFPRQVPLRLAGTIPHTVFPPQADSSRNSCQSTPRFLNLLEDTKPLQRGPCNRPRPVELAQCSASRAAGHRSR